MNVRIYTRSSKSQLRRGEETNGAEKGRISTVRTVERPYYLRTFLGL